MRLGRNILAGVANSVWTAIVGILVVPLYLRYLGIESYGLIGFYATAQSALQLLDMGLAPTMNREVARCSAAGRMDEAQNLLHTLTVVYWLTAIAIAIAGLCLAPYIASHWLQASKISRTTLFHSIALMGLVVACRWPIGLYQGALMGMQRLAISSTINMIAVTFGSLGAIGILAFVSPTTEAFFAWQATIALAQVAVMRVAAWRSVGREGAGAFSSEALKRIWRFSAGMSGIAIASIFLMQVDKVILSTILSLEDFGRYVLAGVVAGSLYVVLSPVFNVVYPRMTALIAKGDRVQLLGIYTYGTRILASILFPIAITVAFFSSDFIFLWTGNSGIATSVGPLASLLIMGTSLNGVMHFPLALQLASGKASLALAISAILAITFVPLIVFLTKQYGAIGSASAWLSLNVIYLFFGSWITHRILLKEAAREWLLRDVGAPYAVAFLVVSIGWRIFYVAGHEIPNVILAVALMTLSAAANLSLLPKKVIRTIIRGDLGIA